MSVDSLLDDLRVAKKKYAIADALSGLAREQRVPPDPTLFAYARDPRWLIRHTAIEALGKCHDALAEELLLEIAAETDDPSDLTYINASLGSIGSEKAIPHLVEASTHRKEDVATSAIHALMAIGSADLLPVFLERLASGRWAVKWYAMAALARRGDASTIDPVLRRVKQILSRQRKRKREPGGRSELIEGLDLLWRLRKHDPRIPVFFADVLPAKSSRLFPVEVEFVHRLETGSARN